MLGEEEYEFDFEANGGYNPPKDFLIHVLPFEAGGALPRSKIKSIIWYENPSPLEEAWDLERQQKTLRQHQEESERAGFEERQRQRQRREDEMQQQQQQEESQRQLQEGSQRQSRNERRRQRRNERRRQEEDEWQRQLEEQDLYLDAMWATSTTQHRWGRPNDETPTCSSSSSPARETQEAHKEHQVHVKMCEYDANSIPRCNLFKSEANVKELLLGFDLKIPYYTYACRCNLNFEGYVLRYADLFPNFRKWKCTWVRPTTYEGDNQYLDFFGELMGEVQYTNTKERVLAKAIAIAYKGFRKILYFQIELAVEDCMILHEEKEKMKQRCELYSFIASEIHFEKQNYDSVLERIMDGHEVLRYELTELGNDASEDDAREMRDMVNNLVKSTPNEFTRPDHAYKEWVSEQINLQIQPYFDLYVDYLLDKILMAPKLELVPKATS